LVKVKKKQEQHNNSESEAFKWHHCALSKERLKPPIVCCRLGNLFLKEAVLVRLLEKSLPPEFAHIKSLRDLQPVNFTPNPAWEEKTVVSFVTEGNLPSPFICPVTGLEVNGHYRYSLRTPLFFFPLLGCYFQFSQIYQLFSTAAMWMCSF